MITHHLSEEMIVEFASGSLAAAETLVASVHVAMCPVCRTAVADFEALGAELLENCAGEPVGAGSLAAVLSRIGRARMLQTTRSNGGAASIAGER